VVLIDLDLSSGDVSVMMNVAAKGSIADLVQDENGMDLSLIESYMVPHLTGVQILAAPSALNRRNWWTGTRGTDPAHPPQPL
jgi:pilus assembly protein CpaE